MKRDHALFGTLTGTCMAGVLVATLVPAGALAGTETETAADDGAAQAETADASASSSAVEGELIVTYKSGTSARRIAKSADVEVAGTEKLLAGAGESDVSLVKLEGSEDEDAATAALESDPRVESVEPNRKFRALETVNDYYVQEYPEYNYYLTTENFESAWDVSKAEGAVTVAVLDSGVDMASAYRDPELAETVDYDHAYDAQNGRSLSSSFTDTVGHGTAVSELIAAQANNEAGIAGVSYDAKVLPVRVLDSSGEGETADILRGYEYVLNVADELGVKVVNMSLGGESDETDVEMPSLQAAIDEAYERGILTVAAAGNEGDSRTESGTVNPVEYPAALDHVVAVGALDSDGKIASWSEHRSYVDIAAAGVDLCVPWFWNERRVSPWERGWGRDPWSPGGQTSGYVYTAGTYTTESGTSFASPIVAGAAALLYAHDSSATAAEVENALETSAVDRGTKGKDNYYGNGELDAAAALTALSSSQSRIEVANEQVTAFKAAKPKVTGKKPAKKSVKLTWKRVKNASGYRVYYRVKGKKSWKHVSASAASTTVSKLKRKTRYQFRVRGYLKVWDGTTAWSKYSATVTAKTK